jgi:hypothetical protein
MIVRQLRRKLVRSQNIIMNRYATVFFVFLFALLITFFFDYWIFWYVFLGGPAVIAGVALLILFRNKPFDFLIGFAVGVFAVVLGLVGELVLEVVFVEQMSEKRIYNELIKRLLLFSPPEILVFCIFLFLQRKISASDL